MKINKSLIFILILSFLPFITIFLNSNLPHTSDGGVQIPRMAAFFKSVRDGHIPVRWAGDLNYGYGMPLFDFIYHTPFYISTILIALGVNLVTTFKFLLFFSFFLSGLSMFLFSKLFFNDDKKALFVTILYQFSPYHLVDILTRGTIGTIYVYSFFPFMLWGITKIILHKKPFSKELWIFYIVTALSTALMILAHNSMALIFFGISVLFVLFFARSVRAKVAAGISLVIGLGLSAFYWIPALVEHKYTYGDLFMKDLFKVNFPTFVNFFIPNPLNYPALRVSEVAVHWGFIQTIALVIGITLLFKWRQLRNETRRIVFFCFLLIIGSTFFMMPLSSPIWEHISFLRQFQFPWRFLSVIFFATSLLGIILFEFKWFNKKIYWFFIIVAISATMYYWKPTQGYDYHINENDFWNYPLNTTYFGETDIIWAAGPAHSYPPSRTQVIDGTANISGFTKITQKQTFTVESTMSARLVSNTQYFPGWKVYVNGTKTPIEFQDQHWRGLITFSVPKGKNTVQIIFEESPVRKIADVISLLFFAAMIGLLIPYEFIFSKK